MGEYADYMLNGDDCAGCGMPFMDGSSGQGFPRYCCRACEPAGYRAMAPKLKSHVRCGGCRKPFGSEMALSQHRTAKGH